MRKRVIAVATIILFFAVMIYIIKPKTFASVLLNAKKEFLLLALLLQANTLVLRTLRWKFIIRKNVSFSKLLPVELLGLSAAAFSPARSGDALKAYLLKKRIGIPISSGMPTILWEEILNLIGYLIVAIWSLIFLPENLKFFFFISTIVVGIALFYVFSMFYSKKSFERLTKILSRFKFIKPEQIRSFLNAGRLSKKTLSVVMIFTTLIVINDATTFYVILKAVGINLNYFHLLPIFCVAVLIGSLAVFLPSGVGSIDGILIALLSFEPIKLVMSATLIERFITMWLTGFVSLLIYLITEK